MRYQPWLEKNIADLSDKTFVITGASDGIGMYAAMQLAYRGAHIIMASRNEEKNSRAMAMIHKAIPNAKLTFVLYDQSSFASIQRFVDVMKLHYPRIDGVLLNAGIIMPPKHAKTDEGFPLTTGVNAINVYYLLRQWLGYLDQNNREVRLVFVGSYSAYRASLRSISELLDPSLPRMKQYAKSKLAMAMFHHVFQMNLNLFDFPVLDHIHALLVHPGLAATNIAHALPKPLATLVKGWIRFFSQDAEAGALSLTYAMGYPYTVNGSYYGPRGPGERFGYPTKLKLRPHFSKGSAQFTYALGKYLQKEFDDVRS
jgi:NAD(P)-dependent dehydrogenase (short-subunit alcohol dehydrogenase family)